jgi:hypothetical protein
MFIQQTVAIHTPLGPALGRFERVVVPALASLVDSTRWSPGFGEPAARDGAPDAVTIGARRSTDEGCLYAIAWTERREIGRPEVDLDLELAPLDGETTHVQFSGQMRFPWVERWSADERAAERRSTIAMTALLDAIGARLRDDESAGVRGPAPSR